MIRGKPFGSGFTNSEKHIQSGILPHMSIDYSALQDVALKDFTPLQTQAFQ
jgi:hypothetical protein